MRNWIDIITENDSGLPYGYWITEAGEFIPVFRDGGHYPIVIDRLEGEAPNEFQTAMKTGWIRVAGIEEPDEISVDTYGKYTGTRAIKALARFLKPLAFERYHHTDESRSVNKTFSTLNDFMRSVAECTSRGLNEAVEMVEMDGYNKRFKTLRDPSPKALMAFGLAVKYNQLRFIISDNKIWFWDADKAVHSTIAACLGIDIKPITAMTTNPMTGVIHVKKHYEFDPSTNRLAKEHSSFVFQVGHINGKGLLMAGMSPAQWRLLQNQPAWARYTDGQITFEPFYEPMDL